MAEKLLVLFATQAEAAASLKDYSLKEEMTIVISGMGCLAAATAVARYGADCHRVLNLGIAGRLRGNHEIGQLFSITSVDRNDILPDVIDHHSSSLHASLFSSIALQSDGGLKLVSSDYPIHHPELSSQLAMNYDLVDMEGYGVAYACKQLNKPCVMWKAVSDFTNAKGPAMIHDQIDHLSEVLATALFQTAPGIWN